MCAILALAVYVLPIYFAAAAHLAHAAEHAVQAIQDMERRAVAMGLTHLHDEADDRPPGSFVHSHGGAPHAHDAGVGALLVAAEEVDEHADEALTAPSELSSHVPATGVLPALALVERFLERVEPDPAAPRSLLPPPLPPPRA